MLITFSCENYKSFRDQVTFSMIASKERQHGFRLCRLEKYQTRILPIATIFGGNASGKTNFFKALSFAKSFIVRGTQPEGRIPVDPFRLDTGVSERPVHFRFELFIDNRMYEFGFEVNTKEVLEEKLVEISTTSEKVLYHRHDGQPHFDRSLAKDDFLKFAFQGTRENQLFLTNSISQKVEVFRPVYNWFKDSLILIAPDSRFNLFEQFLNDEQPLYKVMNEMLNQLDTGIGCLGSEAILFENIPFPKEIKERLQEEVQEGATVRIIDEPMNDRFIITRKNGDLCANKLVTYHYKTNREREKFDMRQESDGSQRIIDVLPAFLALSEKNAKKVFVIDEVNRSLHPLLTRKLIEMYLASCSPNKKSQLLLTTHDVLLMDQTLLRRDEMWIAERDADGASSLISFSEFVNMRYDKDIRKSYLQGRLGGIPKILIDYALTGKLQRLHRKGEGNGSQ